MTKHKLIELNNHKIKFKLNGNTYLIDRKEVEDSLLIYWFQCSKLFKNCKWGIAHWHGGVQLHTG